jgi:hypothetical protein
MNHLGKGIKNDNGFFKRNKLKGKHHNCKKTSKLPPNETQKRKEEVKIYLNKVLHLRVNAFSVSLLSIGLKVYLQIYVGTVLQVNIKKINNLKSLVDT